MTQASPIRTFKVAESHRKWLTRRAFQAAPHEACGFIMADGSIKEIRNVAVYPEKTFEMDRRQLAEINPNDVVALWHSHPGGSIYPSAIDQRNMAGLGEAYGNWAYLIVTKDQVAQYDTATNWHDFTSTAS